MTVFNCRTKMKRSPAILCFVLIMVIFCQARTAMATDIAKQKFQNILRDSLEDLWTGRSFGPELISRQKALKSMLSSGAIKKAELESMMEATILSILNRHKTSRYTLKALPEQFNTLFSPHLNWKEMRGIIWKELSSAADPDNPFKIKVGTLAPPGTPWLNLPEDTVIADIEALSGKKILIQIYGSGVMGEDPDVLEKMKTGQLDGCGCTALGVLGACPEASVLLLPGLFNNYEEVDFICEKFRKRLDEAFEKRGYLLAALIDTGFFNVFLKNYVSGLEGLKNQKIQTWFGILETTFYDELGLKAVHVKSPETVSALSSGKFDATLSPAAWMLGMQAYQYVGFYLKPPLSYSPAAVITSTDIKDRLQKHLGVTDVFAQNFQEMLVSEFITLEPEWKRQIRLYEAKSLKAFETKCGMQALTFSSEDMALIKKAERAVQQKLTGKVFSAELIGDIQQTLTDYRKTHNP